MIFGKIEGEYGVINLLFFVILKKLVELIFFIFVWVVGFK